MILVFSFNSLHEALLYKYTQAFVARFSETLKEIFIIISIYDEINRLLLTILLLISRCFLIAD